MIPQLPEVVSGASQCDRETLLAHIAQLEAELAEARPYLPQKPPPGWLRVGPIADKLGVTNVAVYKMAQQGRIASTKIGSCLWVEPIETRPARKKYKSRY